MVIKYARMSQKAKNITLFIVSPMPPLQDLVINIDLLVR